MEQSDIEKLIGELETALDRLRSLYEQYFVGIERIEPGVPRKDVERRIYTLRREQIRNTALRFRFQMVLQKFNTYQTHWQRVCREIENGTYKRHVLRAERRFGSSRPPRRRTSFPPPLPEPGAPLPGDLAAQLAELDDDFAPDSVDVDFQIDSRPSLRPPPRPTPRPPAAQALPAPPAGPARPVAPAPQPVWKKVAPAGAPPEGPPAREAPPRPAAPAAPRPAQAAPPALRPPLPAPSALRPGAAPPQQRSGPLAPSEPRAPGLPPRPAPATPSPPPPEAAPPRPPPPRPSLSVAPPRPAPSSSSELSEKRLRQIYVEYVDAKRRQNESTAAITYQSVAKSLRESGDKLRQKHGKAVDFEVAVKDGKTILRPVLK